MRGKAYSALGGVFEYLNCDCGYEQWSQYLIERLQSEGAKPFGADVGCGNGYFTRALTRAGFKTVGIDISPQALSAAVDIARGEGLNIEFLLGDITKLKLPSKAGFITAVNDCINYVPQSELEKTFSRVASNLVKGGVFIFDISSERKLREEVGNNTFASDDERAPFIWFNSLEGDHIMMDITVFTLNGDGTYARRDESQIQYIHSEADILSALEIAGFSARSEGHLGGDRADRINFICKRL